MSFYGLTRTSLVLVSLCSLLSFAAGCSRGSSSSGSTGPDPTPTFGGAPTPTPTPVIVDTGSGDLNEVIKNFPNGGTFIVSPGTYGPIDLTGADINGPLTLQADESGAFSGRPGPITILAQDRTAAISLDGLDDVVIEGVSTIGGTRAGILVANGSQIVLLHNRVRQAAGDGIRLEGASAVLVFNNLVYDNIGTGLTARGVNTMEAINNTVYGNRSGGISFLRLQSEGGSDGSPFGFVLNNIIDGNSLFGLRVDSASEFGFDGNFNLNNDGYSGVEPGDRDLVADPLFVFPPGGNFHLQANITGGGSPAIDRGDPNTESFFVEVLSQRTTREDKFRDVPPVDLGYHYPNGIDTPTPVPSFTPRGTFVPVNTATPTFTPTPTPTQAVAAAAAALAAGQSGQNGAEAADGTDGAGYLVPPTPTATATPVAD